MLAIGAKIAALLLVASGCLSGRPQEDSIPDHPYFPLKVGTTWTYKTKNSGKDQKSLTLVKKVAKLEKIGDTLAARLETTLNGNVVTAEHFTVTKKGFVRVTFEGSPLKPPLLVLKAKAAAGDHWKEESQFKEDKLQIDTTCRKETVKVPFGTHDCLVTETSATLPAGKKLDITAWFAKGIGIVKQKVLIDGMPLEVELEKFTPGN